MATLTLDRVWINLVSNGSAVSAFSSDRTSITALDGEVRTYAGGRRRAVVQDGGSGSFEFSLRDCSLTDVRQLHQWKGQLVQLRDYRGQRFVGIYLEVDVEEDKDKDYYVVKIHLEETGESEFIGQGGEPGIPT